MKKNPSLIIGMWVVLVAGILGFIPGLLPFRTNKEFVAEWTIVFFISLLIKNRWLGAFILWSLISQILSTYIPVVGLNRAYILGLHTVVIFSFFYYLLYEKVNKDNVNMLFDIVAAMAILQVLMMLFQYNGIWAGIMPLGYKKAELIGGLKLHNFFYILLLKNPFSYSVSGFMDMVNTSSGLLALSLPVFFRKKWFWGIPFIFAGLWISRSLGGLIPAILITFLYVIVKHRKYALISITGLSIFSVLFFLKFEKLTTLLTGTGRVELWKAGLKIWLKKPLVGWGLQQSCYLWRITASLIQQKWTHYHNEFLNLLMELGFVGLYIAIGYFTSLFIKIKKLLSDDNVFILFLAIMAGLINCSVNFTVHTVVGVLFITYLAIADKLGDEK